MSDAARIQIDPSIAAMLKRVEPEALLKAIRGWVRIAAKPTVYAIRQAVPVETGDLAASIGAQVRYTPYNGEVFAVIGPQADFTTSGVDGSKTLHTTKSAKALARGGGRAVVKAALRGVTTIDENGPAEYEYLIDMGVDHKGHIARKAGGARFMEAGFAATQESFVKVISDDAFTYVSTDHQPPE